MANDDNDEFKSEHFYSCIMEKAFAANVVVKDHSVDEICAVSKQNDDQ